MHPAGILSSMARIAIVGSGIAGLGAAWALSRRHQVTVYEADARLGGHANTVEVGEPGGPVGVDTGFIVYNARNYPNLVRLFAELGVPTEPSDMSFSVSLDGGRFEYQARALGLLAQPANLARPTYRRMIADIVRFSRVAPQARPDRTLTTRAFLEDGGYSEGFRRDFLLPMVACIWSSSLEAMLDYPAWAMIRFLDNHGLLNLMERPRWRTVTGGSRGYVARVSLPFADGIRLATPVIGVDRRADEVRVMDARGGADAFDHVVLATHADRSLAILEPGASERERRVLGSFRYQDNRAVLHRDPGLMPRRHGVWSSWNYLADRRSGASPQRVSLTYWMNRLQNLRTERPLFVTLNPGREPRYIESEHSYRHPQYDAEALAAQERLPLMQGLRRTWFCGSYTGWGFHEDGLRSGFEVAAALGAPPPWWSSSSTPPTPSGGRALAGAMG
jgi:predicted NAD/FAD-binding protein